MPRKGPNLFAGDAYRTLGVRRTATAAEIKGAWKALMVLHHPDRGPGNPIDIERRTRKTAEINAAYESLKTPAIRKIYDAERPDDGKTPEEMARERSGTGRDPDRGQEADPTSWDDEVHAQRSRPRRRRRGPRTEEEYRADRDAAWAAEQHEPHGWESDWEESGPWWIGGLIAIPAAIVYMAGLEFGQAAARSALDVAAVAVTILTARSIGMRWVTAILAGPLLMWLAAMAADATAAGFVRDVGSWIAAPEVGAIAVIIGLGLVFGLIGQVRPITTVTKDYVGQMTALFFSIALVLMPAITLVVPTRGAPDEPTEETTPVPPGETGPTAQTESELNLTRNDWRRIQAGLQALGHYGGTIDGLAGPRTRDSITAWQRTQRGVATSFLNRAHADTLAALAPPAPVPPPGGGGRAEPTDEEPGTSPEPTPAAITRLVVTAEPDSRIVLDDQEQGVTSASGILTIDGIPPGAHILTAEKAGFDTVTDTIEVVEGVSQVVELVARALPGRLSVTTNARNAMVAIDGGEPTLTPVDEIEVESGARLLTVSSPGYETHEQYVDIAPETTTEYHATLEETSLDAEIAQLRRLFDSRSYETAAEVGDLLTRMLLSWRSVGVDVDENLAVTLAIQGQALYALERFTESVQPLYNATRLGQRIELPIKHRHGGGGFRQGFCTGALVYTDDEIAFRSIDDPDHGFAVEPQEITEIERAEAQEGYLSRLNTEVEGRGSMDFVHPNSEQQRRDPDRALVTDIVCRGCNHALAVHEQLLLLLTQNTQ